jgi:DNA-binding Xre family transcriptional regulator
MTVPDYTPQLRQLMAKVGYPSYKALSQGSHVSWRQLQSLRAGEGSKLSLDNLLRLSQTFDLSLSDLLTTFGINISSPAESGWGNADSRSAVNPGQDLREECFRLQQQLEHQRSRLYLDFQRETLNTLESLLLIWPTAAHAAQQNPTAPALQLLPLLKPIEQLLRSWEIDRIGEVSQIVGFDPTLHQPNPSEAGNPPAMGDAVMITHVGYRQGETILYRAKVRIAE